MLKFLIHSVKKPFSKRQGFAYVAGGYSSKVKSRAFYNPVRSSSFNACHDGRHHFQVPKRMLSSSLDPSKVLNFLAILNGKASSIHIRDDAPIADLRMAIKNAFPNALATYDAADLIVKTHADARESLGQFGKLRELLMFDTQGQPNDVFVETPRLLDGRLRSGADSQLDGLSVDDPCRLPRSRLVNLLYEKLQKSHTLLKSPPASGKTSLLQTFLSSIPPNKKAVYVNAKATPPEMSPHAFLLWSAKKQGFSADTLAELLLTIDLLVIDDAQKYWKHQELWAMLKYAARCKLVCAASYSLRDIESDTPAIFSQSIDYCDMKLTLEEEEVLVTQLVRNLDSGLFPWTQDLKLLEIIRRECGGNVGALRMSFNILTSHFFLPETSTPKVIQFFFSSGFFQNETAHRVFNKAHDISPSQKECLATVLRNGKLSFDPSDSAVVLLVKACVLQNTNNTLTFSTPMHERYFFPVIFPNKAHRSPPDIDTFIKKTLAMMDSKALVAALDYAATNSLPKELVFHMEFYRCAGKILAPDDLPIPDVERRLGVEPSGKIADFWIHNLNWLVEFAVQLTPSTFKMRYECRLEKEWDLLQPTQKLLVDFRRYMPRKGGLLENGYYRAVVIDAAKKTAKYVSQKGGVRTVEIIRFGSKSNNRTTGGKKKWLS